MDQGTSPVIVLSGNVADAGGRLSMNEAALALTKSLGRRGVPVFRFHPDRSLADLRSRYCTHVTCPNLYDEPDALVEALVGFAGRQPQMPVLFPASDGAALFIAENEAALGGHLHLTSPSLACIQRTQNKRHLIEAAATADVPVPETHFPTTTDELERVAGSLRYPAIVKPLYSADWKRDRLVAVVGKTKAVKVHDARSLLELGARLLDAANEYMVQEIVPGPDDNLLTFMGYVPADGGAPIGCVRRKLRQFPADFGYCTLTESVHDPEIEDLSARLLKTLDYRGIGCVELKRDPDTGEPKLIEINTRAVRTSALAVAAGCDFPWIAYQDQVIGGASVEPSSYDVPVRWVHLRDELHAATELVLQRRLSPLAWARGFRGKRIVVAEFSSDDPLPGLLLWMAAGRAGARRLRDLVRPGRWSAARRDRGDR